MVEVCELDLSCVENTTSSSMSILHPLSSRIGILAIRILLLTSDRYALIQVTPLFFLPGFLYQREIIDLIPRQKLCGIMLEGSEG